MRSPTLPLIIGLSLCGLSGLLLYVYLKTKEEDQMDSAAAVKVNSSLLKKHKKPEDIQVDLIIPNEIVPLILGRNGAQIKSIESKTQTFIKFREKDDKHQFCEVRGYTENVKAAVGLIERESKRSNFVTEVKYVPVSACGKIIGRCGEALQEILRLSGAKVIMENGCDFPQDNHRKVTISGTRNQVDAALKLITMKVQEDAIAREKLIAITREPRFKSPQSTSTVEQQSSILINNVKLPSVEKLRYKTADRQLDVFVSAVASPARFWIQLIGRQNLELDVIVETMSQYYDDVNNRNNHIITEPYLGQIVAANYRHDGKWYRSEIVAILPNEYDPHNIVLDLYFVDYGDSEYVAAHEVFELRSDFLTLRFQAIECYLANVKSSRMQELDMWDTAAVDRFDQLTHVAKWRKLTAKVVQYKERKPGDPIRREGSPVPGVLLYDNLDGYEIDIGQQLVDEGHAVDDFSTENIMYNSTSAFGSQESLRYENGNSSKPMSPLMFVNGKQDNDGIIDVINNLQSHISERPTD